MLRIGKMVLGGLVFVVKFNGLNLIFEICIEERENEFRFLYVCLFL